MSQQIINVGEAANDGTGEPLRSAFTAVNNNFDQVWAAGPVGSQIAISNNVISTTQTNLDLVLHANGVGNITVYNSITPWTDSVYDLGSANNQFDTVWARYYRGNAALMTGLPSTPNLSAITTDLIPNANLAYDIGAGTQRWAAVYAGAGDFSGNVTVRGNLVVAGNIIEMGNVVTDALVIRLGNTISDPADANGAGIAVGSDGNIASILYDSDSDVWAANIGLSTGNIVIQNNSILDLNGLSVTNGDLSHGPTSGLSIVPNGSDNTTVLYNTYGNVSILASNTGANVHNYQFGTDGNLTLPGNASAAGNIAADYFIGNGSQLTGLPAGYANSNAVSYGESGWAGNIIPAGNSVYSLGSPTHQWNDLYVSNSTIYMNNVPLSLTNGNVLTVNGEPVLSNDSSTDITTTGNITADYFIGDGSQLTGISSTGSFIANGTSTVDIATADGNITITAAGIETWTFNNQGTIVAPYPNANTFPLPLSSAYYVPTISKPSLDLTGAPWQFTGSFAYGPNGEVTIQLDNIFPALNNPGYDSGDTFEFGTSVTGVGGYTLSLTLSSVVQAGPAGWTANPQVSEPFAYPATIESQGVVKITADTSDWTFGTTGDLTFSDGTVFGGNSISAVTGSDFSITTSSLTSVSADCYIGLPNEFVADTEFNDDITVVRAGWTVVVDGTTYTVTYIDPSPPANQYRITVLGATFASGTNYTFTDPVAVLQSWSIDQYGTMTAPGGSRIATDASAFEVQNANAINFEAATVVNIYTDTGNAAYQWQFGDDGNITLPSNTASINYANGTPYGSGAGSSGFTVQYEVAEFVANVAPGFGEIQFANNEGGNSSPTTAQKLFINAGSLNEQQLGTVFQQWTTNSYRGTLSLNNNADQATFNISNGGVYFNPEQYRGFSAGLNQVWIDDCSINQLIITNASAPKYYNTDFLLEDDVFHATALDTGNTHVMLNVYGSSEYQPIKPEYLWNLFTAFVDNVLYDGSTLRTDLNDAKTQFYNNTGSFRDTIPTQDLFQYFRFTQSSGADYFGEAPTTTNGSGINATVRIRVNANNTYTVLGTANPGSGYIGGETLTVLGTDLGGSSPANDLTILIDSVNGDGVITAVSYLNGDGVYPWPSNYISDGSDDQYDSGNYINTNLASEISYANGEVQTASSDFGGGDYCVMYNQSMFCMITTGSTISDLFYSGNLGSDGDGFVRWTGLRSNQNVTADNSAQYAYFDSEYLDGTLTIANGVTYDMTLDSAGINLDEYYAYYNNNNNDYYFGSNNDWRLESQQSLYVQSYNDMFIQTLVNQRGTGESGPAINISAAQGSPGQREINAQAGLGGSVNVRGGDAGGNDEIESLGNGGGSVNIDAGMGTGAGHGGSVYIRGGQTESPTGSAGNVSITTYNGPNGHGRVSITTTDGTERNWAFNPNGTTMFPSLTTQRGDTTGSTITGYTLNGGDGYQEFVITTPNGDPATTGSSAQRIVINPGAGNVDTSGEGGDIYLWAGRGGAQGGSGGDVKIRGGQGMGTGGAGGYIRMEAGDGYSDAGYPGYIEITGGSGGTSQPGGYIEITGGLGDLNGGNANITGGYSISGTGGVVNITGGTSGLGVGDYGNVHITSGAGTWAFDNTGNVTLPGGGIIYGNPYTPSGAPGNTITLQPAGSGVITDQRLLIYPTAADGDHIHLATGNLYQTELFLGNDNFYVKLANTGNIVLNTNDSTGNIAQWTFDSAGTLVLAPISTGASTVEVAKITGTRKIIGETGTWSTYIAGHSALGNVAWTASSTTIQSAKLTFVVQTNGTAFNWEQFDVSVCKMDGANAFVNVSGRIRQNSAIDYTEVSAYENGGVLEVWLNPADGQTVAYVNYNAVEFNIMAD